MLNRFTRKIFRIFSRYQKKNKGPTIYEVRARFFSVIETIYRILSTGIPVVAFLIFGILVYEAGFHAFNKVDINLYRLWFALLLVLKFLLIAFFVLEFKERRRVRSRIFNVVLIVIAHFGHRAAFGLLEEPDPATNADYVLSKVFLFSSTLIIFLTEASAVLRFIYRRGYNPAFLFVSSFFAFILIGALLLLLPNSTTRGISPVDAWFTSASAVCVTGLVVVDTASSFTTTGKVILLCLIQLGGLGIMTFAGLLSYLSAGTASFRSQLALKDMLSSGQISSVISLIGRVVIVTFSFEAIGSVLIFYSLENQQFSTLLEKIFFSIFHAVSAFCNAGFSTYSDGLHELPVRFNYSLQLVIAALVVLGGLGFPIVFNIFAYIRLRILKSVSGLFGRPFNEKHAHIFSTTSRLALMTTLVLLVFGFVSYFVFEFDSTLNEHGSAWGKIVTSAFGSVTPRTAGFNTVQLADLTLPTIMIYLLLMWIGASPGSTGGGIKTTTIAVAFLNLRSVILGKDRTEVSRIQIGTSTINRAFAIMLLSLLIIGVTVLILAINEPDKQLFALAFEGFSAFSTVGLSLGVTPDLSITSKLFLSIVMLTGRVGTLTILFALVTPAKELFYRYPKDEISL
jgi:Trk-type K+ transport system membrane component